MALDPSTFRQAQGIATLPANPDDSGNEPTSDAPIANTLTPPAAAPAQPRVNLRPAPPAQPPVQPDQTPGNFFRRLSHSFAGALIGTLAGSPGADYSVDDSGKTVATPRPDSARSRIQRIAQAALEGLAHGAAVDSRQYPNGFSKAAAGFGAGFIGTQQRQQAQDAQARQQSQQDYERQQKTLMDKAVRASHNASTYSLWQKAMAEANDHDPERQKNMDLMNAANDFIAKNPGMSMSVQIATPQEVQAMREADSHSIGVHTFLPIGFTQAKDADGNPLFESDGVTPKQIGQIAVISGGMDGGKLALPQSFVDDLQKYGKAAGIRGVEQYKAGMAYPLPTILSMDKAMNPIKAKAIDGWKTAKDVVRQDGTHAQQNEFTNEVRDYPAGVQPNTKNEVAGQAADIKLKAAQTENQLADAAKKRADASGKNDKPIYAYNTMTKQREQTTRAEMNAAPAGLYKNPVDIKETDLRKDTELARQLGDAQMNISRYRAASQRFDQNITGDDRSRIAALFADDRLKAGLWGTELPTDWLNKLYSSAQWDHLSPEAKDALVGYTGARGAVIAYQKAVSGSGRANKEQLELELQNIPNPLEPRDVREKKFDRFQSNIDQTGAGLPKLVGIDRPQEIRQRIEAEEAKKDGATHIYEPNSRQAIPVDSTAVKNIFGKVIGYKDAHGRVTVFQKQ